MLRSMTRLVITLGLAGGLWAQTAQSTITVKMDNIGTFTIPGWSFGTTNATVLSTAGGTSSRAQISALNLVKEFDDSSTKLFYASVAGTHVAKVELTQIDPSGKHPPMVITLENVMVSSYQLGGNTSAGAPGETISLTFIKITIEYNHYKTYWDLSTNKGA